MDNQARSPQLTVVSRDVTIDRELFSLVVETKALGATARTAIHRQHFRRRIGGVRIAPAAEISEVGHLASAMTFKCGASLLPFDGEKSVICGQRLLSLSTPERADLVSTHLVDVVKADAGATIGPDMYAGEDVMDQIACSHKLQDHVTGRSRSNGGLGVDSNGATAEGLFQALGLISDRDRELRRVTIQGFGAVGAGLARRLLSTGLSLVAVSNYRGTLESRTGEGLDIELLLASLHERDGAPRDELELERYARQNNACVYRPGNRARIFEVPTDVFVPAARTTVLATREEIPAARLENPEVANVAAFLTAAGPRLVIEGANYPLTSAAEAFLEAQGVRILPDFVVNLGGLVSCIFEWLYLPQLLEDRSAYAAINEQAAAWSALAVRKNVHTLYASAGSARDVSRTIATDNLRLLLESSKHLASSLDDRQFVHAVLSSIKSRHMNNAQ